MVKYPKMMASLLIVAMAMAILPTVVSAIPMPVPVKGVVKYANGTMVPDGWTVTLENLNESYDDEPWNTTTDSTLYPLNYFITGTAESASTFLIKASDPEGKFSGEETFTASPLETKIVNITVRGPPKVEVIYPSGGETIKIGDVVEVSARAIGDYNITSVEFSYYNGTAWNPIGAGDLVAGSPTDGIWNTSWDTFGLPEGTTYQIMANAIDESGNTASNTSGAFTLADLTPPLMRNASAVPSKVMVNETTNITFYVDVADRDTGVLGARIDMDPGPGTSWKVMTFVGSYSADNLTWNIYKYETVVNLPAEGIYNYTVEAYDKSVAKNGNTTIITVEAISTKTYSIQIYEGWNLISLPLMPEDTSIDAVIPNASNGDWIYADEPGPGITWTYAKYWNGWSGPLTNLTPGQGYLYYRAGSDFNLTIIGKPLAEANTTIYEGWNLIGYAKTDTPGIDIIPGDKGDRIYGDMPGPGIEWTYARYWDGWSGSLTNLTPGQGYFYNRAGPTFYWTY